MSLSITVTFADSVNGSTTDTFSLNDADAATFLSVLAAANTPRQGPRQQQQTVTPLAYDALYHQIANNFWLGLQGRVKNIQMRSAQSAAMATANASVRVISASAAAHTTPTVKSGA